MKNVPAWTDREGGPVNPTGRQSDYSAHAGMTLRQYFAAQAMTGFLARSGYLTIGGEQLQMTPAVIAKVSFQMADAMVAEALKE